MAAIESEIADALVAQISAGVPALNSVSFDKIKLAIDEFQPYEIPAVQIYDIGQDIVHMRGRKEVEWAIAIEIILKNTVAAIADQKSLWDLRRDVELAIWATPNLGIPKVIHAIYTGNVTDLHLLEPYYVARMDMSIKYNDDLTGSC